MAYTKITCPISGQTAGGTAGTEHGSGSTVTNAYAMSFMRGNKSNGDYAHAEGNGCTASGTSSFATGYYNTASGAQSLAAGRDSTASGNYSFATGLASNATGIGSIAAGSYAYSSGDYSFAGSTSSAITICSWAEGKNTVASGKYSHSEGNGTNASGDYSSAFGDSSVASGNYSTALSNAKTYGNYSMAMYSSTANYSNSHCFGSWLVDNSSNQVLIGYNYTGTTGQFMVGCANSRKFRVYNGYVYGSVTTGQADYAEMFEWADGNPNNEDRVGYFVKLIDGDKIEIANSGDEPLGIISGQPSVVGDAWGDEWKDKYVTDKYRRVQYENYINEEGITSIRPILSSEYDENKTYISRIDRPEWDSVGLLGKLIVRDDGTCQVGGKCTIADGGIATAGNDYYVIKRIEEKIIKIYYKFN